MLLSFRDNLLRDSSLRKAHPEEFSSAFYLLHLKHLSVLAGGDTVACTEYAAAAGLTGLMLICAQIVVAAYGVPREKCAALALGIVAGELPVIPCYVGVLFSHKASLPP